MSTKTLSRRSELFPSVIDDFFKPWNEWFGNSGRWGRELNIPAVNVVENDNEFTLSVAAPGLKKSDFNIDMEGNMLTVSTEKEESKEEKDARYTRKEYNYSSFSRSFTLPEEVNKEKVEAKYEDGVLKLILPKKEDAKKLLASKHIAVK